MQQAKLTFLFSISLLALMLSVGYVLYKFVIPQPGAVALAISGVLSASVLGYHFGKAKGRLGVGAATWACTSLALLLSMLYIATATPDEKYAILTGMGYFAIPFAGIMTSLYGAQRSDSSIHVRTSA